MHVRGERARSRPTFPNHVTPSPYPYDSPSLLTSSTSSSTVDQMSFLLPANTTSRVCGGWTDHQRLYRLCAGEPTQQKQQQRGHSNNGNAGGCLHRPRLYRHCPPVRTRAYTNTHAHPYLINLTGTMRESPLTLNQVELN